MRARQRCLTCWPIGPRDGLRLAMARLVSGLMAALAAGLLAVTPARATDGAPVPARTAAAPAPAHVIDERGRVIALRAVPLRIVSLLPSLTETVCALGACDRLVAVDDFSNWPASVRSLPRVGGLTDARVESIVALKPDLVLAAASTRALERLERLGLNVVALEPTSLEGFRRVSHTLDRLLATGRGEAMLRAVDADLQAAMRDLPAGQRGQSVYFEVGEGPYAASESSFIGELLARVGARNVVPASLGPFPRLNPEFVVRADPQVIMLGEARSQAMAARPGWSTIRAVREQRICRFTPEQADVLVRPGPRLAQGARLMVDCLRAGWKAGPQAARPSASGLSGDAGARR